MGNAKGQVKEVNLLERCHLFVRTNYDSNALSKLGVFLLADEDNYDSFARSHWEFYRHRPQFG